MSHYSVEHFDLPGYDQPIKNDYWTIGSDTLLIMLPGLGYTNQMPLMFYLHEIAQARSWDVLQVHYDYRTVPRETSSEEWIARFLGDVRPLIDAAMEKGRYKNVVLAGKSIGTNVMTTLLSRGFEGATAFIWLTPLLRSEPVRQAVMNNGPSIALFGDKDYAVADVNLTPISQAGVHMIIVPGADHSMMIEGNVPESIAMLAHSMRELENWLDEALATSGEDE